MQHCCSASQASRAAAQAAAEAAAIAAEEAKTEAETLKEQVEALTKKLAISEVCRKLTVSSESFLYGTIEDENASYISIENPVSGIRQYRYSFFQQLQ